jgi:hypothetical protein
MCWKWKRQSPFGMSFWFNWYEEIRSGHPSISLAIWGVKVGVADLVG